MKKLFFSFLFVSASFAMLYGQELNNSWVDYNDIVNDHLFEFEVDNVYLVYYVDDVMGEDDAFNKAYQFMASTIGSNYNYNGDKIYKNGRTLLNKYRHGYAAQLIAINQRTLTNSKAKKLLKYWSND